MSKPACTRYRTRDWSSYYAPLGRRRSLTVWVDPSTPWHAVPSGKSGAQPVYRYAATQACLTVKVLFGLQLGQKINFVASLLELACPDWQVTEFSTLCRRQESLAVQLPYRSHRGSLYLLIDSTKIMVRGKANGTRASTEERSSASGARSHTPSTNRPNRFGRPGSRDNELLSKGSLPEGLRYD